ncbi:ABC-2 family transporter [Natranaerovirga hydrolytica]|uniref:ABC-2 family transporter n=1 Tax=Natranaerovirga hydrolytica TaxID=680378 RepID=A0A4R1N6N9_9FIRM|nr:ABC transporter permease subunit [Natranaerovirga hydrolytica]TCK98699.1 ABC-2 family transporter [Natranaerovirga hydrolytica]
MINPVFRKELKIATRSWKFAMMLFIYIGILAAIGLFIFSQMLDSLAYSSGYQEFTMLYVLLGYLQFGLILFVVPALTAGSISGERERQTLEILLSTPLKSRSVLIGKLLSSLSTVILLVIASMPVLSLVFIFGGVTLLQLFGLLGYFIVTTIFIGSIGIFVSTVFKRTTVANVMAYGTLLMLSIGTMIFALIFILIYQRNTGYSISTTTPLPLNILYLNPIMGFSAVILEQVGISGSEVPFALFYNSELDVKNVYVINIIAQSIISIGLIYVSSIKLNAKKSKVFKKVKKKKKSQKNKN